MDISELNSKIFSFDEDLNLQKKKKSELQINE